MKEALFILIVLAVIFVLTAVRYRKQIAGMLRIYRSLQAMKQGMKREQVGKNESVSAGPLVNCARCGTWVPEERAIKLRGGITYCSAECLETTGSAR